MAACTVGNLLLDSYYHSLVFGSAASGHPESFTNFAPTAFWLGIALVGMSHLKAIEAAIRQRAAL